MHITQRSKLRKKPFFAQALWLVPFFGLGKNLIDTLFIGKDSISERKFTLKEKFFKTLSALFSLNFRFVILFYSRIESFNTYLLLTITTLLQAGNWGSYIIGVYFSGELQNIIFRHKSALKSHTTRALRTAKQGTQHIVNTTKKSAQKLGNTIKKVKIKR